MLMDSKNKFDLLFIDSDLRDVDVITFLRLTKDMNIIPIGNLDQTLPRTTFKNILYLSCFF